IGPTLQSAKKWYNSILVHGIVPVKRKVESARDAQRLRWPEHASGGRISRNATWLARTAKRWMSRAVMRVTRADAAAAEDSSCALTGRHTRLACESWKMV